MLTKERYTLEVFALVLKEIKLNFDYARIHKNVHLYILKLKNRLMF